MNIPITKDEHQFLLKRETSTRILFGSRLYGTNNSTSDYDYLCFYFSDTFDDSLNRIYKTNHQFQYKDVKSNTDYIWTDLNQFYRNLWAGDSIINADIMLFTNYHERLHSNDAMNNVLEKLRNYKVIKAYLGYAKRDLKQHKEGIHKIIHARRCLYIAGCLIDNEIPNLNTIQQLYYESQSQINSVDALLSFQQALRDKLNHLHERGVIKTYYVEDKIIESIRDVLYNKLINSINIKQFKYE